MKTDLQTACELLERCRPYIALSAKRQDNLSMAGFLATIDAFLSAQKIDEELKSEIGKFLGSQRSLTEWESESLNEFTKKQFAQKIDSASGFVTPSSKELGAAECTNKVGAGAESQISSIKKHLAALGADERKVILEELFENICLLCGSDEPCYCAPQYDE